MRAVDPECQQVVDLELSLLQPSVRTNPAAVLKLLHPAFREIGAAGRVWTREDVADAMAGDAQQISAAEIIASRLAPDVVLITYRADRPERSTLRSSVWVHAQGRWLLRFHQGTIVHE